MNKFTIGLCFICMSYFCYGQNDLLYAETYGELNASVYGQSASRIAVDNDGNVFQTGTIGYGVSFSNGGQHLNSGTGRDVYLLKRSATGDILWSFSIVSSDDNLSVRSIDTDLEGNVVICGRIDGNADFDPSSGQASISTPNNPKGFIAKYNPDGEFMWVRSLGSSSWFTYAEDIVVDDAGNIYVTGDMGNDLNFGGSTIYDSAPSLYVIKMDASGGLVWMETYQNVLNEANEKMADIGDEIVIFSRFSGWMDFDSGPGQNNVMAIGPSDLMFVILDKSNGDIVNTGPIPRNDEQRLTDVQGLPDGRYTYLFQDYKDDELIGSAIRSGYVNGSFGHWLSTTGQIISSFMINDQYELFLGVSGGASVSYNPVNTQYEIDGDGQSYLRKYTPEGTLVKESVLETDGYVAASHMAGTPDQGMVLSGIFIGKASFDLHSSELNYTATGKIEGFISAYADCVLVTSESAIFGCPPIMYNDQVYTTSGTYTIETIDDNGCSHIEYVEVDAAVIDTSLEITPTYIRCGHENADYKWYNSVTSESYEGEGNIFYPPKPGKYHFTMVTDEGCLYESRDIHFPVVEIVGDPDFEQFGRSLRLVNDQLIVGTAMDNLDAISILNQENDDWNLAQIIVPGYSGFGADVSALGNKLLISSPEEFGTGFIHAYDSEDMLWSESSDFTVSNQGQADVKQYGRSIANYKDLLFVGAPGTTLIGNKENAGFVQVVGLDNDEWQFQDNIVNLQYDTDYRFGEQIKILDDLLFIAEPGFQNMYGSGRIHIYRISESGQSGDYSFDRVADIVSGPQFGNIRADMHFASGNLVLYSNYQVTLFDNLSDDPQMVITHYLDEGHIHKLTSEGERVAISSTMSAEPNDYVVGLYAITDTELRREKIFRSFIGGEMFGHDVLLRNSDLFIAAPEFQVEEDHKMGKVYHYDLNVLSTSTNEVDNRQSLVVYPNPTSGEINIRQAEKNEDHHYDYQVVDKFGQVLLKGIGTSFDTSHLSSGLYFLQINLPTGRRSTAFVKID